MTEKMIKYCSVRKINAKRFATLSSARSRVFLAGKEGKGESEHVGIAVYTVYASILQDEVDSASASGNS